MLTNQNLKVPNEFTNQTEFSENPELCVHEDAPEEETEIRNGNEGPAESQEQNEKLPHKPFNIEKNTSVPGSDDFFSDKNIVL